MDPTTILLLAMAAAGYFLFVKDDKKGGDGRGGRHAGRGGQRPPRGGWGAPPGGPGAPPGAPPGPGMPPPQAGPRAPSGPGPLLDQLDQMIAQAMAVTDPDDAVSALKLVGQFGVSQVGPAIDRQTANRSKALTTAAAHDNATLQAIPTSKAGWLWATTILFPFALLPQLAGSAASSVLTPATSNDKMKASGLIHAMYEKYASALDQFGAAPAGPAAVAGYWPVAGWGPLWGPYYATGVGTVIPSQYKKAPGCSDAVGNPQLCASVASALATETNPAALRALAANVAGAGFPAAANTLLAKADALG